MGPRRPKMDARWIQEASRGPQAGPKWTHKGPNGTKVATQMEKLTNMSKPFEFLFKNEGQEGLNGGHGASLGSY